MRMPKRGLWALAFLVLLPGAWAAPPTDEELEAADRKELVTPAPPDFKPEAQERKLKLTLIARDSKIKKGENFWYRLEVQNVGQKPIPFVARWSYFKIGYGEADKYRFLVTPPGGSEEEQPISFMLTMGRTFRDPIVSGGEKMSEEERAAAARKIEDELPRKEALGFGLKVNLAPGETLRTRSWKHLDQLFAFERLRRGEDAFPKTPGDFRELSFNSFKFNEVGVCRLRVVFDEASWLSPPDEEEIQEGIALGLSREWQMRSYQEHLDTALGPFESNAVEVEVVP